MPSRLPSLLLALLCLLAPFHCAIEAVALPGACCGSEHGHEDSESQTPHSGCAGCPALESDTAPGVRKVPEPLRAEDRLDGWATLKLAACYRAQTPPLRSPPEGLDTRPSPPPACIRLASRPATPRGPPARV
jgi:hypothetical protein